MGDDPVAPVLEMLAPSTAEIGIPSFTLHVHGTGFVAESIMAESTGLFEVALFDAQSGRSLTFGQGGGNGFIDSRMLTGPGGLPFKTFGSPLLQPRRAIKAVFNDLSGQANTIFLSLLGRRMRMPVG